MALETPRTLRASVFYQVFPRLHSVEGNFAGVRNDLTRIRELGADILYLMPIHPMGDGLDNRTGSPYGIHDHRAINPEYGTVEELQALTNDAHQLGLKVILDVVLHHLSGRSQLAAERREWFLKDAEGNLRCKVEAWKGCVDLDYSIPEVWQYQIDTLLHLLSFGIDGFRFDVVPLIPIEFWREARRVVDPDRKQIWLAETGFMRFVRKDKELGIIHHTDPELHEVFDLTYDADSQEFVNAYFVGQAQLCDILHQVYLQEVLYPAHAIKLRLLESHDDVRFAAKIRDLSSLRSWTAFMALLPGSLLLYAGQEYAIGRDHTIHTRTERHYHRERNNVEWGKGDSSFCQFVRVLLEQMHLIKNSCRICHWAEITRGVVRIDWRGGEKAFSAIINLENRHGSISIPWRLEGVDLFTKSEFRIADCLEIPAEPLLLQVDPHTVSDPMPTGQTFQLHGGSDWSAG